MIHLEENTQIDCVNWMRWQHPSLAPYLHHSPNGGKRSKREAGRFKAMGVKAGFPDLALYIPRNNWHGLFIEMKTDKGRQSESQKEWQKMLTGQGYLYVVCRGFEEFKSIINTYIGKTDG